MFDNVEGADWTSAAEARSGRPAGFALRLGETHFRRLLETLPAGAYTCDPQGLITYYNPHAVGLWGRAPTLNDPTDRWCGSFRLYAIDGEPIEHARCWMALAVDEMREYNGQEIVVERPDGERRTVLAHANPIHDEDGNLLGGVNVLVDITDRKEAESARQASEERLRLLNVELERRVAERTEELRRINSELKERNHDLEQFAYAASHDLQEPLRMVASCVQVLARHYGDGLDESGRRAIGFAVEGAQRMQTLIQDLLAFSRVGSMAGRVGPVRMRDVVRTVMDDLQRIVQETRAEIHVAELPTVQADPGQMRQLFQNVLGNALKFRKPGIPPRIHVDAVRGPEAAEWVFAVRDEGIGLNMSYSTRVFEMFQRLHGREEYEGTGIGLAICKRIVERHGGRTWLESEKGRGCTVYFTIPDDRPTGSAPSLPAP